MADYYTQFAFAVTFPTENDAFTAELFLNAQQNGEADNNDNDDNDDNVIGWFASRDGNTVYLQDTDSVGNAEGVAITLHQMFAAHFPDMRAQFSVAYTCSKPRVDEFGGAAYLVTAKGVWSKNIDALYPVLEREAEDAEVNQSEED